MRTSLLLIAAVVMSFISVSGNTAELTGNFSYTVGALLTDDDFSKAFDLDKRIELGVICDAKKETWPVSIAVGYFLSYGKSDTSGNFCGLEEDRDTDIICSEFYLGIKKIFDCHATIKPYIAGGFCSVNMYADISCDHEYDGASGGWFGAGAYFKISRHWQLNLEWRRSKVKVHLFDNRLDAGGDHFDLSLGYQFPL